MQEVDMFVLHIQNLSNELNAKIVAFDAQQFNYEFCDTEKGTQKSYWGSKTGGDIMQSYFSWNATFEEYKSELVAFGVSLEKGRIIPHLNHFSTLCLDVDIAFKSSELMDKLEE